jgi:hypothetical protein
VQTQSLKSPPEILLCITFPNDDYKWLSVLFYLHDLPPTKGGQLYDYTFILGTYTSFMKPATEASWKQHCHSPKLPMFWFETQVTPQAQRCGFHVSMSHILHSQYGEQNIDADFQMDNTNLIHGYGRQTLPADTHSPWDFWMPKRHLSCGHSYSFWTPMLPNPNPYLNLWRKFNFWGFFCCERRHNIIRLFLHQLWHTFMLKKPYSIEQWFMNHNTSVR